MGVDKLSIISLANKIQTESDAYLYLEDLRWNGQPVCPHCGSIGKHYFLNPANGISRKTRTGANSQRRVWRCADCREQFSVLTGTVMHGTKLSIRTWIFVFFEMASSKNGVAAREIERKYGVNPRTAWHLTQRIREAMKADPIVTKFAGTIVADETYVGGEIRNKHRQGTKSKKRPMGRRVGGPVYKTPVFSIVHRETGEVRSWVMPGPINSGTVGPIIESHVVMYDSELWTDSAAIYRPIGLTFAAHEAVDHQRYEYVRGEVSTNAAEGYFAQLKRSLDGTHHHVSSWHLHRYVGEFDFRFTTCEDSDATRMARMVRKSAGKHLSYDRLTGRNTLVA
jgi:transposase-like protein